jgi:hypothetical protein
VASNLTRAAFLVLAAALAATSAAAAAPTNAAAREAGDAGADAAAMTASLDAAKPLSPSEERAARAEAERDQAQRDADNAHTEAERLVSREYARLLAVEEAQTAFGAELLASRKAMDARREATLDWQRRAAEVRLAGDDQTADETYEALRQTLRAARDVFAAALGRVSSGVSDVPQAGSDPLAEVQVEGIAQSARAERARIEAEAASLETQERALHADETAQLDDEIDALNRERLALLPGLSAAKRGAITGFTLAGLDQASSELRQLTLTLRYQRYVVTGWLGALRHPDRALGRALAGGVLDLLEWLLAIAGFFWWRRRSQPLLRALHLRAREGDRRGRLSSPSRAARALGFVSQVNRPAEWLLLVAVLYWLLPASVFSVSTMKAAPKVQLRTDRRMRTSRMSATFAGSSQ